MKSWAMIGVFTVLMGAGAATRPATTQTATKPAATQAVKPPAMDALVKKIEAMPKKLWPDGNSDSSSSRRQLQDAWMLEQFKKDETVYTLTGTVIEDSVSPAEAGKVRVRLQCGPVKICGVKWNDVAVSAVVSADIGTAAGWTPKTKLTIAGKIEADQGVRLLESAGSVEISLRESTVK